MKSVEKKVSPISDYFIFSPSKTAQETFLYPLQCGLFTYDPGYTLKRSSFDSFLLMYIQRGAMLLDLNGKQQAVKEKSFVLIDCYQPHGYSTREGYECLWMHFDGVMARNYYEMIVSRLKNGTVDIVIGTHRLLQGDVEFKNLGLIVVDEEQRFGVAHKEKLKNLPG